MEAVKKSRGNSFWTIAVILNILFSVISVGFFIYKVHVLEGEVFQLRSDLKNQAKARESEDADLMNRNKRAAKYHGDSKPCTSCHNACVQLFGLGASAKVFIKISKLHMLSIIVFNNIFHCSLIINSSSRSLTPEQLTSQTTYRSYALPVRTAAALFSGCHR